MASASTTAPTIASAGSDRPRVCLLHVGGTIGMTKTPDGLRPVPGVLERYLAGMPELTGPDMPLLYVERLDPLLDSADMDPHDWVRIARAIIERDQEFDGFVVLHGTDTMVYTASALSFLLSGLRKPVVLTGSQLSLEHVRSDGREHIITSIIIAGRLRIPEVCIYFASRLLRGNRAQKIHNSDFVAFGSGNLPPLATVGVGISVDEHLLRAPGPGLPDRVELVREPHVAALRVFPGVGRGVFESLLAPPLEGLVLETYGAGTFPTRGREGDEDLIEPLRAATSRTPPVIVVNCSQCHGGIVRQDVYAGGRRLTAAGVISGHDMTPEAALTKLYCLLAMGLSPDEVRRRMGEDLAGELDARAAEREAGT
ncbi:MAG: asparaginase domain-containing protein [Nannocystaceae bacterium]|nr:asparaginase domain-containing protein [Nannocystaceae bacterium]